MTAHVTQLPGSLQFSWPDQGVSVQFVYDLPAGNEQLSLLNLRRGKVGKPEFLAAREFHIEVTLPEGRFRRVLGIIEGTELVCFLLPHEFPGAPRRLRIPTDGLPYNFDSAGPHSLRLLLLDDLQLNDRDIAQLDAEDDRTRRAAAKQIFGAARPPTSVVLTANFEVVSHQLHMDRGTLIESAHGTSAESQHRKPELTAPSPMLVLTESIKAVPAVKYALGVTGMMAAVAIIFSFKLDGRVAFVSAFVMLALMACLVVFARMASLAKSSLVRAAQVLTWCTLLLFVAVSVALFTSVFFKVPLDLTYWLTGSS